MDVGVWLRSLGLGRYEVAFSDNSIDADVLPDLTDGDLAQLGVNLGDRKRLLKAIAGLGAAYPVTKPTRPPSSSSMDGAERRPITVMFCDLVGSTGLAARLDAEDWRNLVGSYLDEASAAVTGFGGHVLKKLGDGLMALFGYPQAQENDAERAVRAALAIQRALAEINERNAQTGGPQLIARIGLESGSVVVDATGEVFGEAPNVAARVQAAAEPGTVLVTASVQRQTAGLFVAEDRGAHELKGVLEPVTLYRIVRASGAGRRSGARVLTPLVGREEELQLLSRRWERARNGEGQLALIVGEPGLGKSRLIEEFRARLGETPHTWVEWQSSQLLQNTPLHPVAEWGRLRYGTGDTPEERRLADLENTLQLIGLDAAEYAPLLGPLFDVPLPEDRAAKFAPEELRRRQLSAMTALFLAGARSQPIVLAFEDLHWADPTSLDLLRALAERGSQAPLLLLATTRPEFRPPWSLRSHHSLISLSPLDRAGVACMVGEISAGHALSKELIEGVNERTGGVPLFVEEVTRLLLERGERGDVQAIPPTLQQSLAARLDRLGPAREIAQIGAVLGRNFAYSLLRDVAEQEEPAVQASLARLADADLLIVEGAPPQANYRFKHALIQDAAYDSLLKSHRRALHRRAAELLRNNQGRTAAEPEVIAHHFKQAGLDDQAIEWWGKAGDQALRRSAFPEATAHLGKAIAMADKAIAKTAPTTASSGGTGTSERIKMQTDYGRANRWTDRPVEAHAVLAPAIEGFAPTPEMPKIADVQALLAAPGETHEVNAAIAQRQRRLHLQTAYGYALMWSKGFAAEETKAAFVRVGEFAVSAEDASARFAAFDGQCLSSVLRGELSSARETAEIFLREAEAKGRATEAGVALRDLGFVLLNQGDLKAARSVFERALANYIPERDGETRFQFGRDTEVTAASCLALAEWHLGEPERARQLINRAFRRADELGSIPATVVALYWKVRFECHRQDASATRQAADALLALTEEHGIRTYAELGWIYANWARGRLLDPEAGAVGLRQWLDAYMTQGNKVSVPYFFGLLAELEAKTQGFDHALTLVDHGLAIAEESGEHLFDPYLHRLRGELLLCDDTANPAGAEESLKTAVAVAKQQSARSPELLASLSLAKLYQSTARSIEARAVLAPALGSFAPTPEMPEIAEAQALIERLS